MKACTGRSATMPLPEKWRFTLEELGERWACSVEDVLRFGCDGFLKVCTRPDRGVLHDAYVLNALQIIQIQRHGRTHLDNPFGACFTGEPSKYDKITIQDLFVRREERDRFEREHQLGYTPDKQHPQTVNQQTNQEMMDTDALAQFRQLPNLVPEELCLRFLPNLMVKISAQGITKSVSCVALELVD